MNRGRKTIEIRVGYAKYGACKNGKKKITTILKMPFRRDGDARSVF